MHKVKIAVATNINFYKLSLNVVLKSLVDAGIDPKDIHVFNAGFDESSYFVTEEGMTLYKLNHNSYEYSPLIEIVEKEIESEYWFLIHDTCQVGPKFKELLYNIPENKPEKVALRQHPAMSIGVYRYDYLLSVKDKLLSIKNSNYSEESLAYWKYWGVSNEDFILWKTHPAPPVYNNIHNWQVINYDNWYGTGTIRRTEYYPALDLYKNKSNWGQSMDNMHRNI